jgi:hypothetical protein
MHGVHFDDALNDVDALARTLASRFGLSVAEAGSDTEGR